LEYNNNGNANATNTLIQDLLPANTSFVSASDGGSNTLGVISWPAFTLNTGVSDSVTLTVLVDSPLDNGTEIYNIASLESDQTAPVTNHATSSVQSTPLLSLGKGADRSLAEPGEQVVYSLDYGNSGNANATGVTLADWLPANTSFVSATGGGTELDGLVTWPLGSIIAGDNGSVMLTVAVDSPLDNATLLDNIASLESTQTLPTTDNARVVVQSAPVVTLVKTASVSLAQPDDLITYTLTYGNSGNANAANAVLTDAIPANTTFVSATGGGTSSGGIVTWINPLILAGSSGAVTMTVQVDNPLPNGTVIPNLASLVTDQTIAVESSVDVTIESAAFLTLEKTASANVIQPGDLLTYTLNIINTGNANATNVVLTDSAPMHTSFVSATGPYSEAGGVVTWTVAELPVGIPASVTMTVQIDFPVANGTNIVNDATLTSDLTGIITDSIIVNVHSIPILNLDKTADHSVVNAGDLLTYTLSLSNSGNANAIDVVLTDAIPARTTFVSATGGGIESDGTVTWTNAELPVGIPVSVTLTVWVDSPLDNGTSIINHATLDSLETPAVSTRHILNVQSTPVLSLEKTADKTVVNPGDQLTYTLTMTNSGNANASNIILQDTLPPHTTFVSASNGGSEAGGIVTWIMPELQVGIPGAVTLTVQIDSPLPNGTPIYNSATRDSDETAPVSAEHSMAVQSAPVLTLVKTADRTVVNPGEQITYTLTLDNIGNAHATNVILEDTIPDHTTFVSASGSGTEVGGVVTWTVPELLVGNKGSVTLTVELDSPLTNGTPIYNSATLDSDETAPVSAEHSMAVQSAPVLTLVKTADRTVVNPGDQITYTLTLDNAGNTHATNVILEDTIPDHTTFVSASGNGTEASGVVTWSAPLLPVGTKESLTVTVELDSPLPSGTLIYNSASLDSDETAPVSADHSLAVQSAPILVLVKTANKTVVNPGETITYTINFANNGNANASGVALEDNVPANTTFVSATGGGVETGGIVTWIPGSIDAGTEGSVALTVEVNSPLDDGISIYNSVTLESDQVAPVSADHSLAVQSAPVLSINQSADKTIAIPGDQITYTISINNRGNANANNAVLEDTIPAHTVFISATGEGIETDGVVTWNTALLLAGVPLEVTLTVEVDSPLPDNTLILNNATLSSDDASPVSSEHKLVVNSAPVLLFKKTADKTVVSPSDQIVYTLEYNNNGNANAT
ncbi:hypothetical protein DRQ32_07645, partial [bacterium]